MSSLHLFNCYYLILHLKYLRHRHGSGGVSCVGPRVLLGISFRPNKLISDDVNRFVSLGLGAIGSDAIVFIESSSILNAKRKYAFAWHTNKHTKIATVRLICLPDNIMMFCTKNFVSKIYLKKIQHKLVGKIVFSLKSVFLHKI